MHKSLALVALVHNTTNNIFCLFVSDLFVVGVTIVILGTPLDSSPISTPAPETLYSAGRVNFAKIRNHMCNVNTSVRRLMSTLAGKVR